MKFKIKKLLPSKKTDSSTYEESEDYYGPDSSPQIDNEIPDNPKPKLPRRFQLDIRGVISIIKLPRIPGKNIIFKAAPIIAPAIVLLFVPFEQALGDDELVTRIHIGLLATTAGAGAFQLIKARKPRERESSTELIASGGESGNIEHLTKSTNNRKLGIDFRGLLPRMSVRSKSKAAAASKELLAADSISLVYSCGHSFAFARSTIKDWINQGLIPNIDTSKGVLKLAVVCSHCSKTKQKPEIVTQKKKSLKAKKIFIPAIIGCVLVIGGLFGSAFIPDTGFLDSAIQQISTITGGMINVNDYVSSGSSNDLLSGEGSVDDISSLEGAIQNLPGTENIQLGGLKPYTFSDGHVKIKDNLFALEIANDENEKSRGLSFSEGLKPDQAFLVRYDQPTKTSISMVSANFYIDILWLDADNEIIGVQAMVTECKLSSTDLESSEECVASPPSDYYSVLYIDGGTAEGLGIVEGDVAEILTQSS